jgi:hypothetical protein
VDERGGGPISIWIGFLVFLSMLLFAVQVLFNLYAASVVTAVTYDAARRVAGSGGGTSQIIDAEQQAVQALGRYGQGVTFDWSGTGEDEVVLRVHAVNPGFQIPGIGGPAAFDSIDRTIRIRVERFR